LFQQFVNKCGLAVVNVRDDRDIADIQRSLLSALPFAAGIGGKILNTKTAVLSFACLCALAACGGGATSSGSETNQFVLSSDEAGFSGTGLQFASAETGQVLADVAPGDSFQIRVAGYQNLEGETEITPTLTTETITLVDDGFGNVAAEITFLGETFRYSVTDAVIDSIIVLPSGREVVVQSPSGGLFSDVYEIFTYEEFVENPVAGGPNTNASFVVGFETDPAVIAETTGAASYRGLFEGYGGLLSRSTDAESGDVTEEVTNAIEVSGTVQLSISFDDALVDATLDGSLDGTEQADFQASLDDAPIVGNSFFGDLAVECLNGFTCTSNSEMGGAFYGPDADEAVGLISFDVEGEDDSGNEIRFVSGAFFGSTDQGQ